MDRTGSEWSGSEWSGSECGSRRERIGASLVIGAGFEWIGAGFDGFDWIRAGFDGFDWIGAGFDWLRRGVSGSELQRSWLRGGVSGEQSFCV